ncbi:extracellular chitinase [Fusarium fujikuroi]|nr:extracellular chitinase [Fusarium fujikuroi]SCV26987.1 related to extracellular chitinase [Fusarium fujikuroi]
MRFIQMNFQWHLLFLALVTATAVSQGEPFRCIMYLTGQHDIVPSKSELQDVSHVILAFMRSETFNVDNKPQDYPLFTSVSDVRKRFPGGTKVMIAIGGWGDTQGFEEAAKNETTRKRWARQVAAMVTVTGADGIDIDWEYPGGNRDDYKQIPNSQREWEINAFVSLLQELRAAIGPDRLLSAAVPGKEVDLMAFTPTTVPKIMKEVDFLNIMTYDLMNRRDVVTKHHSGVSDSQDSIQRYIDRGASPGQLNLGFGYYVKWFMTQECSQGGLLGCPTQLLEDPETGADLGKTGGFSWHDEIPQDVSTSFERAKTAGTYDKDESYFYWDAKEWRWWTFDTKKSIQTKFSHVVPELGVGGVFAWGIGEDAPSFEHFQVTAEEVRNMRNGHAVEHDSMEDGNKDEL